MKLSFECNQDPRKMPNIKGKKFCSLCQKHVFDLRRKSDEKIATFYKLNPTACAIVYQEQLDKLVDNDVKAIKLRRLFPYAASLLAVSILPNLIIANPNVFNNNNTTHIAPQSKNDSIAPLDNKAGEEKYFVDVSVKLINKKLKQKQGREIVIYQYKFDSLTNADIEDTLAFGIIGKGGKVKLEISKKAFELILQNEDLSISIDGLSREIIERVKTNDKTLEVKISASGRRPRMGAKF